MTRMGDGTPEKMPHVTSSAAIAPGCSAQRGREWGGGERHRERQMVGSGQKYRNMGVCGNTLKPGAIVRPGRAWSHGQPGSAGAWWLEGSPLQLAKRLVAYCDALGPQILISD